MKTVAPGIATAPPSVGQVPMADDVPTDSAKDPFIQMTIRRTLCQKFSLVRIKVQVTI